MDEKINGTSDDRIVNNVMRHEYRILNEDEKEALKKLKDMGVEMHEYLATLGASLEIEYAKQKVEEAVMWGVKHITA